MKIENKILEFLKARKGKGFFFEEIMDLLRIPKQECLEAMKSLKAQNKIKYDKTLNYVGWTIK